MCFAASEQNTCTSTDELLQTGKENSCTCRKTKKAEQNYLRTDFLRIQRLALLQKGSKTMIRCFQDFASCVCLSSRRVFHLPFRHHGIQGKNPFATPNNKSLIQASTPFLAALPLLALSQKITARITNCKTKTIKITNFPAGFVQHLIAIVHTIIHTIVFHIMKKHLHEKQRTKQECGKSFGSNHANQHKKVAGRTYPLLTSSAHSYY